MQKIQSEKKGSSTSLRSTDLEDNKLFEDQQMIQNQQKDKSQGSTIFIKDSFSISSGSDSELKNQHPNERSKILPIFISLLILTLVISVSHYYKEILSYLVIKLQVIEPDHYEKNFQFNENKKFYKISSFQTTYQINTDQKLHYLCPNVKQTFHVDFNQQYQNKKLPINIQNQIELCQTPILGMKDLTQLKQRWNKKFGEVQIKDEDMSSQKLKQNLLVLLKLFFSGGSYINITVPYSNIDYRCQKAPLVGFDTIFASYSQINQNNIVVPNADTFMKVKIPYSPFIKQMVQKIVRKQDFLEQCRRKQCLIIKCID